MKRKALLVLAAPIGGLFAYASWYFLLSTWLEIFQTVWRLSQA